MSETHDSPDMTGVHSENNDQDIANLRREYTQGGLDKTDLSENPIDFFSYWLEQTKEAKICDPTAMVVATVDHHGQPFQRTVLLKHFDDKGFIFYTNLGSRKAQHIGENSKVSLHFPWHMLDRQVHITGVASKLKQTEVISYFLSRPKESQISAWASKQSARISTRQLLEGKFFELKEKFAKGEVPVPTFWGGYRVEPTSIEFWQGGEHRLHDRFLYSQKDELSENGADTKKTTWDINRLAP